MCARHFARNTHLDYNVIEHTPHMNADIVIHLQCNIERLELGWYFILHIASIAPMGVAVIPQWEWQSFPQWEWQSFPQWEWQSFPQWAWQSFGMAVNFGTPVPVPKPALKMPDQLSLCCCMGFEDIPTFVGERNKHLHIQTWSLYEF